MRYSVDDDFFPAALVAQAAAEWPGEEAPWVRYDSPEQRKRTLGCRRAEGRFGEPPSILSDWLHFPPACRDLLTRMLRLDVYGLLGVRGLPDTLLWGAGLHEMRRGDYLGLHLDADRHPLLGLERRANAILYLGEWDRAWGGELELWDGGDDTGPRERLARIPPAPGRLVLFETSDTSWHGSPTPITCPEGAARRSLAVYWWGQPRGESVRPRARFAAPSGGEPPQ